MFTVAPHHSGCTDFVTLGVGAAGLKSDLTTRRFRPETVTMIETTITLLAIICAASVSVMSLMRWYGASGFKAMVYMAFAVFSGLIALLNLSLLLASDGSFVRTAALGYLGFATAIVLPAARVLANVTYDKDRDGSKKEDATV